MLIAKRLHQLLVKVVTLIYGVVAPISSDTTQRHSAPRIFMLADESIGGLMSFDLDIGHPNSSTTSLADDIQRENSAP